MTLMTQENALVYAKKIIDIHPGTLREPEGLLIHLEVTGDIAGETYDLAESHYGPLPMKREEVVLGGTLHDIGRAMRGDQTFHELRGSLWIQENGHIEGVATTLEEVYKIAQIVLPHGLVYERWIDPSEKVVKQREEWEPFDISRLLPRTWQEAIVSHAEISNAQGERLDWRIRAQKNLDKYTNDEKYCNNPDAEAMRTSIQASNRRIENLFERIESLRQGTLSKEEVYNFYGFN